MKENCEHYLPDIKGMTDEVRYVNGACKINWMNLWGDKVYLVCNEKNCPKSLRKRSSPP